MNINEILHLCERVLDAYNIKYEILDDKIIIKEDLDNNIDTAIEKIKNISNNNKFIATNNDKKTEISFSEKEDEPIEKPLDEPIEKEYIVAVKYNGKIYAEKSIFTIKEGSTPSEIQEVINSKYPNVARVAKIQTVPDNTNYSKFQPISNLEKELSDKVSEKVEQEISTKPVTATRSPYYTIMCNTAENPTELKNSIAKELSTNGKFEEVFNSLKENNIITQKPDDLTYNADDYNTYFGIFDLEKIPSNDPNKLFYKKLREKYLELIDEEYQTKLSNNGNYFQVVIKVKDPQDVNYDTLKNIASGIFPQMLFDLNNCRIDSIPDITKFKYTGKNENELAAYIAKKEEEYKSEGKEIPLYIKEGPEPEKESPTRKIGVNYLKNTNGTIRGTRISGLVEAIPDNAIYYSIKDYNSGEGLKHNVKDVETVSTEVSTAWKLVSFYRDPYTSITGDPLVGSVIVDTKNGVIVGDPIYNKEEPLKVSNVENQKIINRYNNEVVVRPNTIKSIPFTDYLFDNKVILDGKDITKEVANWLNDITEKDRDTIMYINFKGIAPDEKNNHVTFKVYFSNFDNHRIGPEFDFSFEDRKGPIKPDKDDKEAIKEVAKNAKAIEKENPQPEPEVDKKSQTKTNENVAAETLANEDISKTQKRVIDDIYSMYNVRAVPASDYPGIVNAVKAWNIPGVEVPTYIQKGKLKEAKRGASEFYRLFDVTGQLICIILHDTDRDIAYIGPELKNSIFENQYVDFLTHESEEDEEEFDFDTEE